MTRFLNVLLVALFGTYFYLEYREPNAADAAPVELAEADTPDTVARTEDEATSPEEDPVRTASVAPTTQTDATAEPILVDPINSQEIRERVAARDLMALPPIEQLTVADDPEPAPAAAPQILRVTGSVVNARSGPGTGFDVVTRLRRGQELFATGDTDGVWAKAVVVETGEEVWMHTKFLAEAG